MEFKVIRISEDDEKVKPCEEALNKVRFIDNKYRRRIWVVELGTLSEIIAFIAKYGKVVILQNKELGMPQIEIYDDYRE